MAGGEGCVMSCVLSLSGLLAHPHSISHKHLCSSLCSSCKPRSSRPRTALLPPWPPPPLPSARQCSMPHASTLCRCINRLPRYVVSLVGHPPDSLRRLAICLVRMRCGVCVSGVVLRAQWLNAACRHSSRKISAPREKWPRGYSVIPTLRFLTDSGIPVPFDPRAGRRREWSGGSADIIQAPADAR